MERPRGVGRGGPSPQAWGHGARPLTNILLLSKAPQGPAWPDFVYSIDQRLLLLLCEQPGAGIRGRTPGEGPSLTHSAVPRPASPRIPPMAHDP